jgi:thiol:disulfide interchange protein DsbD
MLLVLLLGMLMSLTPCIYPMIPITIGILHGTRSRSRGYRLLRALCYMLGVAFMFALLGAIAAFTGTMCGSLLRHPLMIMMIVFFLLYLAFAMFDWYELRLPRFLVVRKHGMQPSDSLLSAFMFGFASGTIASPCLSPGLAFLLCIVTALGSKLLGFALLFAFGVGMSIPLLLIGTFAPVINYVPRAGSWMLGVKKLMGVLLVALSFYFLSMVIPVVVVWWLVATIVTVLAGYVIITAYQRHRPGTRARQGRLIVGMGLMACAVGLYWYAAQPHDVQQSELITWQTSYAVALQQAQDKHKLLFVDIGAPYCSVCKAIDHCVFTDIAVAASINQMVPLKLDTSSSPDYDAFNKKYQVLGVPTILIINPISGEVLKQFGGELYSMPKAEVVSALSDLILRG